jgi:AmiR/NasT family two-component response regulator
MNIGPAIGVMMAHYGLGHDEARQLLREVSNRANRKVADLAAEIVKSVDLPAAAKKHLRPSTPHSRRGRR